MAQMMRLSSVRFLNFYLFPFQIYFHVKQIGFSDIDIVIKTFQYSGQWRECTGVIDLTQPCLSRVFYLYFIFSILVSGWVEIWITRRSPVKPRITTSMIPKLGLSPLRWTVSIDTYYFLSHNFSFLFFQWDPRVWRYWGRRPTSPRVSRSR